MQSLIKNVIFVNNYIFHMTMKRLLLPLLLLLLLFGCAKSFPESTDSLLLNPDLSAIPTEILIKGQ